MGSIVAVVVSPCAGAPTTIPFPLTMAGLVGWWDAREATLAGSDVATLTDLSETSDLITDGASNRPAYVASGDGGLPELAFDSTNRERLSRASIIDPDNDFTVVGLSKHETTGGSALLCFGTSDLNYAEAQHGSTFMTGAISVTPTTSEASLAAANNAWHTVAHVREGTANRVKVDASAFTTSGTAAPSGIAPVKLVLGCHFVLDSYAFGAAFGGRVAALLIFSRALSVTEIDDLRAWYKTDPVWGRSYIP